MKRLISLLLILLLALTACKGNSDPADDPIVPQEEEQAQVQEPEPEAEPDDETAEADGNGVIVGVEDDCYYIVMNAVAYRVVGDFNESYEKDARVSVKGTVKKLSSAVSYNGYTVEHEITDAELSCIESDADSQIKGAKPVIYLYPEKTTDVTVSIDLDGEFTCLYPEYDGKWQVSAQPDGTLTDKNGREYYCLYFECINGRDLVPDKNVGFMVKGEDTAEFLRDKALELGLNEREASEFIIYWLPQMQDNPYNYVYFAIDEYQDMAKLNIAPAADTQIRFMMMWQALDKPYDVTEQILPNTPARNGFTVVEWGGAEIK